ncbi:MAG: T9SS type B sorting domain-containing protein, partial [Ferruginibacter sp.]
ATLNLAVGSVVTSTTNISICPSQLPFTWNSQTYNLAGVYSVTLISGSGCDSIATLNLALNSVTTSTTNVTVCSNQLPYLWNGQNYSTAGPHVVTLVNSQGCDSTATLNLTINSVTTSTTNITVCSNQLPYSWNGQNYSTAGPHVVTLVNSQGCDSTATLNLAINSVTTSTTNVTVCSNQLPYSWNGQNFSTVGPHIVTLINSVGCDSTATLNLAINSVTTSTTNVSVCDNHLPFVWNGQSYSATDIYTVVLTSAAGCDSVATLHLTVNPVVYSTTNASICSNQLPYNWNGQSYSTPGAHSVTLTSLAGCDSVATLNLTINQSPSAPIVTSPVNYCQYATPSVLTAAGSNQLLWYTVPTAGIGSTIAPVPSTTIPGTFNYYVSQTNGICEGPRSMITVRVNGKPALGTDKSLKICFGSSADLRTLYNTSGLTGNWTYGQAPVTNPSAVMLPGIYQLLVTNSSGCSDTALVTLAMQPPVIANAGNDGNAEYNIPYQLNGSGGIQYLWSPATSLNNSQIANPLATLTQDTRFVLMVIDEIGCKDYDTVNIRVFNGPTFYVPTAFTPNGDGLNDIFRPTSVGISSLEYFRVYNRYGELLYETSEITKGWDGRYKGVNQNIGTYVWAIRGVDRKGELKTMKGYVVLIR